MQLSKDTLLKLGELVACLERDIPSLDRRIRCAVLRLKGGTLTLPVKNLSLKELEPWFWSMTVRNEISNCWEWTGNRDANGYGYFKVLGNRILSHRASLIYCSGTDSALLACHKCHNPPCVNPFHLYRGTHADNDRDKRKSHRMPSLAGERNPNARLTEVDVRFIRTSKLKLADLGAMFGMTPQNIWRIKHYGVWRDCSPLTN